MNVLESSTRIAFKNILFLTDFSEASQAAMEYAAALAKQHDATLYPAYVQTPTPPLYLEGFALTEYLDEFEEQNRQRLAQLIAPFEVHSHALVGEGMLEYAVERWTTSHGIDLIVVGTHGWKGLQRMLLGSTAELVLRTAACPVLNVGPHVSERQRDPEYIDRILFATDLTQATEYAVSYALSFARERCARLTLLHVLPENTHVPDNTRVHAYCENELRRLVTSNSDLCCDVRFVIAEGEPDEEILSYAETDSSDLIVLGLPKEKVFSSLFHRSVTYSVVSSASCPVLTVRDMLQ